MTKFDNFDAAEEFLQPIMNKACEKIDAAKKAGASSKEAVLQLELDERMVYVLGSLNYEVCNGGFAQWRDNGFGVFGDLVLAALKQVGGEFSLRAIPIVEGALEVDNEPEEDEWGQIDDSEYDDILEAFNEWDNRFYSFNEDVICELGDFLAAKKAA